MEFESRSRGSSVRHLKRISCSSGPSPVGIQRLSIWPLECQAQGAAAQGAALGLTRCLASSTCLRRLNDREAVNF